MKRRFASIFGLILSATTIISAQAITQSSLTGSSGSNSTKGVRGSASFGALPRFASPVVKGAPYSGEEVSEHVQTVADGTRFTQSNTQRKVYRDAEGRVRTERPMFMGNPMMKPQADSPTVIEITDPVAGFHYVLDTENKVAHRQVLPEPLSQGQYGMRSARGDGGMATGAVIAGIMTATVPFAVPPPPPPPPLGAQVPPAAVLPTPAMVSTAAGNSSEISFTRSNSAQGMTPKSSTESLATQTIDGVLVEGKRYLTTYPVGMMGNDREFSTTSESWMSPELNVMVLTKSTDPRTGDNIFRIANLSRTPPDPSLFMVPPGYTVVDEKSSFTINYGQ